MPYKSDAQRRWAHTKNGTKALGGKEKVKEWDEASKGMMMPEKSPEKMMMSEKEMKKKTGHGYAMGGEHKEM